MNNRRKILSLFCVYGLTLALIAGGLSLIFSSPFYLEKKARFIIVKSANRAFGKGNYVICKIPAEYCVVESLEDDEASYVLLPGAERFLPNSDMKSSRCIGTYVQNEYVIIAIPISAFSPEDL